MKELWYLFFTFCRIGGFTFGGGYAMLPMLQKEVVEKNNWVTSEELMDYYAVGQCTPGIIAVNTATFIGYKLRRLPGAIAATLGVIAPSIVIITIIAALLSNFLEYKYVGHALAGISAVVCALIADAVVKLWKTGVKDNIGIGIFIAVAAAMIFLNPSPILIVVLTSVFGIIMVKTGVKKL